MRTTVVQPFNPYGGHDRWSSEEQPHVVPSLVKRILDGEEPLVVWGSGQQRRNFLHALDVTRLMLLVLSTGYVDGPINIGYEDNVSVTDLVQLICRVSGRSPAIIFDRTKSEDRFHKAADARILRSLTGNYARAVSMEQGVSEMAEWYKRVFPPTRLIPAV
jgi:nucleoside-diphosphate-sugar epimerase